MSEPKCKSPGWCGGRNGHYPDCPLAPEPADQTRADVVLTEAERAHGVYGYQVNASQVVFHHDDVERIVADRLAARDDDVCRRALWCRRALADPGHPLARDAEHAAEGCRHTESADTMWGRLRAAEATVARAREDVEAAGRHLARVLTDDRVRRQGSDRIFLAVHDAQNVLARVRAALDGER